MMSMKEHEKFSPEMYFKMMADNQSKFEKYRTINDQCNDLCNRLEQFLDADEQRTIQEIQRKRKKIGNKVDNLTKLIRKNDFKVCVVGNENIGKSSIMESFLGNKGILPIQNGRTTYTITEISSCDNDEEQELTKEYFTQDEFSNNKTQTEALLKSVRSPATEENVDEAGSSSSTMSPYSTSLQIYQKELEEIAEAESNGISEYLNRRTETKKFRNLEEIREEVKKAVTDKVQARAVKRVRIRMRGLGIDKIITFVDVPGYNSPFLLHKQQTKALLEEANAIIFVKEARSPHLNDTEYEILENFIRNRSRSCDKILVALARIDEIEPSEYGETLRTHIEEWDKHGIARDRIVPTCAKAYLAMKEGSRASDEVCQRLRKLGIGDNIEVLKDLVVKNLLKSSFIAVKKEIEDTKHEILMISKDAHNLARVKFPNFKDKHVIRNLKKEKQRLLNEWWVAEWGRIVVELEKFMSSKVFIKDTIDSPFKQCPFVENLKRKYQERIEIMRRKTDDLSKNFESDFQSQGVSLGNIPPIRANSEIRHHLRDKLISHLKEVTTELSKIVIEAIEEVRDWIFERMWSILDVKSNLYATDTHKSEILQSDIEALVFRIALPAISLFIETARVDGRRNSMENFENEIILLDLFYYNDTERMFKTKGLASFLAFGEYATEDNYANLRIKLDLTTNEAMEKIFKSKNEKFENIKQEILRDTEEFFDYMKHSIFYASGIERFLITTIDDMVKKFKNLEKEKRAWEFVVMSAIKNGHLIPGIPDLEADLRQRKIVCKLMSKLENPLDQDFSSTKEQEEANQTSESDQVKPIEKAELKDDSIVDRDASEDEDEKFD